MDAALQSTNQMLCTHLPLLFYLPSINTLHRR
jgi:hypothetical protein